MCYIRVHNLETRAMGKLDLRVVASVSFEHAMVQVVKDTLFKKHNPPPKQQSHDGGANYIVQLSLCDVTVQHRHLYVYIERPFRV